MDISIRSLIYVTTAVMCAGVTHLASQPAIAQSVIRVAPRRPTVQPDSHNVAAGRQGRDSRDATRWPGSQERVLSSSPSNGTYLRYTRPGQCIAAGMRLKRFYWRTRRPDTVVYAPATDSVPKAVLEQIRQCGVRFERATIPERDLLDLARLYTLTGQPERAEAAIERLLAANTTQGEMDQAWTLHLLVASLLGSTPSQPEQAQTYLAKLDALGLSANYAKMGAYSLMARYHLSVGNVAAAHRAATAAVNAGRAMGLNDRLDFARELAGAYTTLAEPTSLIHGALAALDVLDTAASVLSYLPPLSSELAFVQSMLSRNRQPYTLLGKPSVAVHGSYWYNVTTEHAQFPVPGQVTLLVTVESACGGLCFPMYATLRRLHDKYGHQGMSIVLMATTKGYFRNRPQPKPADEAERMRRYWFDFLQLPGVLAVEETAFTRRPDGRRLNETPSNLQNYGDSRSAILIGKDGIVRAAEELGPERERILDAAIAKALK